MPKIRVYELAKELKLDNKDLIGQLIEMGFNVRNHMSILSHEETQLIYDQLRKSRSEIVEEHRVTDTIIRRRRKHIDNEEIKISNNKSTLITTKNNPVTSTTTIATLESKISINKESDKDLILSEIFKKKLINEDNSKNTSKVSISNSKSAIEITDINITEKYSKIDIPISEINNIKLNKKITNKNLSNLTKKRTIDTPARIISKPITTPLSQPEMEHKTKNKIASNILNFSNNYTPRKTHPSSSTINVSPTEVIPLDKNDERRRKKNKKNVLTTIPDDEFLMRKASNRRKEILNKADLYDEIRPSRLRKRGTVKKIRKTELTTPKPIKRRIKLGEAIQVNELAKRIGIKSVDLIARLLNIGMIVSVNQVLNIEETTLIANEFGFEIEWTGFEEKFLLEKNQDTPEDLISRPPVVTIMGHVDHGKTSLLDVIRRSKLTAIEAGGITQHIGAYNVKLPEGGQVIFLDTPGHEAFTQMRARGAKITDVVVLVVAADDGVMKQTREAINHSKAAGVPIIVAINKIDKPGIDSDRIRRELADEGLLPETWGGDTIITEVSAKTGQGVNHLLDMLVLQSELLELTANPLKAAQGHILEARLDKGRGPMATVLIRNGTLKIGNFFICGIHAGKVRAMFNDLGQKVDIAGPSMPVEIQGFPGVPTVGDEFLVVENEKISRQIAEHRAFKKRESNLFSQRNTKLETFYEQMTEGIPQELKIIIKADVQGSVEALVDSITKLGNKQIKIDVIHSGAGAITETDIMLASASHAIIIGFNIRTTSKIIEIAENEHVDIRIYDVIYKAIDDITAALTGLLAPIIQEEIIGRAEVRQIFTVPKLGMIAGCAVIGGKIERSAQARLLRNGTVIVTSKISSLRRFKDDVKEVMQGLECGISLDNYNDIKIGDEIEVFIIKKVAAEL